MLPYHSNPLPSYRPAEGGAAYSPVGSDRPGPGPGWVSQVKLSPGRCHGAYNQPGLPEASFRSECWRRLILIPDRTQAMRWRRGGGGGGGGSGGGRGGERSSWTSEQTPSNW
eukprot:755570-Hanusia_phi.AAC.1